jgi:hypothetical protein
MASAIIEDWNGHYDDAEIMCLKITVNGEQIYGCVAASEDGGWVVYIDSKIEKIDGTDECFSIKPLFTKDGKLNFLFKTGNVVLEPGEAFKNTRGGCGCSNCQ